MKHQLREDPRRKKKRRGEENKNKQREKPDALIENSRRRPFIDDRADREIADFPPLQRNESHGSASGETERNREREGEEGKREMRTERIRSTLRGATSSVSREGASTTGPVLFQAR